MFEREVYAGRRGALAERLGGGLAVFPGNGLSPRNFVDNPYYFQQDSTFLYYFGLDQPDLAGVLDVDEGRATVYGDDLTVDELVWTAEVPPLSERARRAGVEQARRRSALKDDIGRARSAGRTVHWLPPYRAEHVLELRRLVGVTPDDAASDASEALIRAVVAQRSRKSEEEVREIERAVELSVAMHEAALRLAGPGVTESEIAAEVERVARAAGGRIAFPVIATIRGQTLHNHVQRNRLSEADLFVLDAGAQVESGYAGDLTTTWAVGGGLDGRRRDLYAILLQAYDTAVAALSPGVPFRTVHLTAARVIFEGLKELGLMRGDPDEAVAAGAHALVFPHGLGHMMGLDVHDMENLGEDYVGYADDDERSHQFGLRSLRLARELEPGFVLTVEPGIYFIPRLIDDWRARGHCAAFIDFPELDRWRGVGGMRNEEDYLITPSGARRLGPRKPQTLDEIEAARR